MNITISVFFSGTGHDINDVNMLAGLLNELTETNETQKKIGFDGCGQAFGFNGSIFGTGLDIQCQQVIEQVETEIKKGNKVTLNAFGHSRGGIGAIMLAQQLSGIDPKILEINLGLHDQVPGNYITTSTLDIFDISLAQKTMDLRECKPLKRVLSLYPNQPLPAIACHAPLVGLYPKHTIVDEDVIAGCHAGAQMQSVNDEMISFEPYPENIISFARMYSFLKQCGTHFKPLPAIILNGQYIKEDQIDQALIDIYQTENNKASDAIYRDCHSARGVYINTKQTARYFNLHHQRLLGVPLDKTTARLTIEENQGLFARLKRAILQYPKTASIIKWGLVSLSIATLTVLTGGLSAIPMLAGITANLGLFSIFFLAPLVACLLIAVKPIGQWLINKFYYPEFSIRDIRPNAQPSTGGSVQKMSPLLENNSVSDFSPRVLREVSTSKGVLSKVPKLTTDDQQVHRLSLNSMGH